jgi:hypothetical protein
MQIVMKIALMFFAPATLLGLLDLMFLAAFSPLVIALMAARLIVSTRKAFTGSGCVRKPCGRRAKIVADKQRLGLSAKEAVQATLQPRQRRLVR